MFAFILLITAVDVYRIKQTSELGMMSENLAIFFAFQIYYDFIYIFIRILAFIASRRD
jgi:FtsH-binding integral membrane protein